MNSTIRDPPGEFHAAQHCPMLCTTPAFVPPHSAFETSANATKTPLSKRNERKNDRPAHATQVYQIEHLGKAGNKNHLHCAGTMDRPRQISIMRVVDTVNSLRKIKGPLGMSTGKLWGSQPMKFQG